MRRKPMFYNIDDNQIKAFYEHIAECEICADIGLPGQLIKEEIIPIMDEICDKWIMKTVLE